MPPLAKDKLHAAEFAKRLGKSERIPMGKIFTLAKEFTDMPPAEIEKLLESPHHEMRVGAVSVMDWKARAKVTTDNERKALFDLYIRRHDRIDSWDLVDRSAPYVVGGYLAGKARKILYKLARSANPHERRSAIVSTYFFIRQDDLDDTFGIAQILVNDKEEVVQKAVGSWVREAGKRDPQRLLKFLDKHAATMPRIILRFAIEKLSKAQREHYLGLKAK
ncbi:MAG TPA: DNA alkylation repair protein [Aestuariivirga sp.]|nr:DNA alkylation repair protein [Aestuariivirga sp.]